MSEQVWRVVRRDDGKPWPCTVVDHHGKSLVDLIDGTPVIRDADLAERIVRSLNTPTTEGAGA